MELFTIEGQQLTPTAFALADGILGKLWEEDKSPKKEDALSFFKYIYLSKDPRSQYYGFQDQEARAIQSVWGEKKKIPGNVKKAADYYYDLVTNGDPLYRMFEAAKIGLYKVEEYFKNVDFSADDAPRISDLTRALKDVSDLVTAFDSLDQRVKQKTYESRKTRASRAVGRYEE